MAEVPSNLTQILLELSSGDASGEAGSQRLYTAAYEELRSIATGLMRQQKQGHTLQPTALVHEAYLKLIDVNGVGWEGRAHFLGIAARAMRQILVDHARSRASRLRVREQAQGEVNAPHTNPVDRLTDLLALDDALTRFAREYQRESEVTELRYFAGLSVEQVAEVLDTSPATVKRDWAFARAWLLDELGVS